MYVILVTLCLLLSVLLFSLSSFHSRVFFHLITFQAIGLFPFSLSFGGELIFIGLHQVHLFGATFGSLFRHCLFEYFLYTDNYFYVDIPMYLTLMFLIKILHVPLKSLFIIPTLSIFI